MENKRYNTLFSDDKSKAEAFDKLAEKFYNKNFGSMSKSDFEVLMFSVYIDRILKKEGDENFVKYSDYTLSKELGITQSKVSNLKVKKQMQYPYESFDWRKSFSRVMENARYENNKIKIQIPDINLFNEIKNAVEESGGYIDLSLTQRLLQVSPEFFIDLLVAISEEDDKNKIKKELRKFINKEINENAYFAKKPFGQMLKDNSPKYIGGILQALEIIPGLNPIMKLIITMAGNILTV